jgi:hypothetical protein
VSLCLSFHAKSLWLKGVKRDDNILAVIDAYSVSELLHEKCVIFEMLVASLKNTRVSCWNTKTTFYLETFAVKDSNLHLNTPFFNNSVN